MTSKPSFLFSCLQSLVLSNFQASSKSCATLLPPNLFFPTTFFSQKPSTPFLNPQSSTLVFKAQHLRNSTNTSCPFRNLSSGKPSCLHNSCFSRDLNNYPCNFVLSLSNLSTFCGKQFKAWNGACSVSGNLILSVPLRLLQVFFSLLLMEKISGTFRMQNVSLRSLERPVLDFSWEHSSSGLHQGPGTQKISRVPSGRVKTCSKPE